MNGVGLRRCGRPHLDRVEEADAGEAVDDADGAAGLRRDLRRGPRQRIGGEVEDAVPGRGQAQALRHGKVGAVIAGVAARRFGQPRTVQRHAHDLPRRGQGIGRDPIDEPPMDRRHRRRAQGLLDRLQALGLDRGRVGFRPVPDDADDRAPAERDDDIAARFDGDPVWHGVVEGLIEREGQQDRHARGVGPVRCLRIVEKIGDGGGSRASAAFVPVSHRIESRRLNGRAGRQHPCAGPFRPSTGFSKGRSPTLRITSMAASSRPLKAACDRGPTPDPGCAAPGGHDGAV